MKNASPNQLVAAGQRLVDSAGAGTRIIVAIEVDGAVTVLANTTRPLPETPAFKEHLGWVFLEHFGYETFLAEGKHD